METITGSDTMNLKSDFEYLVQEAKKPKKKYNRLSVSISDETKSKLEYLYKNRKIQSLTKSAIVEDALLRYFDDLDEKYIKKEDKQ